MHYVDTKLLKASDVDAHLRRFWGATGDAVTMLECGRGRRRHSCRHLCYSRTSV